MWLKGVEFGRKSAFEALSMRDNLQPGCSVTWLYVESAYQDARTNDVELL
jgi:hypothetical protein